MDKKTQIRKQFIEDLDVIIESLISSSNLRYKPRKDSYIEPLIRWLDYVLRVVEPRPRNVYFSSRLSTLFRPEIQHPLELLIHLFEHGIDVNPYQSDKLKRFQDVYAKKKYHRTDLLWADWGIHHFHLTEEPIEPSRYFSKRSTWLAFCYVTYDTVFFIDVKKHDENNLFTDKTLVEILFTEWPAVADLFELKGVLPSKEPFSPEETMQLRYVGMPTPFSMNGKVYMGPGMGITTAGTSSKVSYYAGTINMSICKLADYVSSEDNLYLQNAYKRGISNPKFSIKLTPKGLGLYEEKQGICYLLPRREREGYCDTPLAEVHELVIPSWLIQSWEKDDFFDGVSTT
ncbi:hypothetical protein [Methylophaga thalassica]|uniref:hypothetical protein n=1 Tax=Methylophaga thalassica TaxID=40223 RepID=UPI002E7AB47E|nr:hypothetical protein [Methylophaga thalassica]WVI84546.1 hypothetical protein VSX76_12280 [Methylophaga thalassica]